MTLSLYEDALAPLQDHLPDWWAAHNPASVLYAFLYALAQPLDALSANLEVLHSDMALVNASLDGLRTEYAYAYGIDFEQLPPTVGALRAYIQTWAGVDGSTPSVIRALTAFLKTPVNTTGASLVFDAGGAGLTFPSDGSSLLMFQQVLEIASLSFPVDGTGLVFAGDGTGITFPDVSGWVIVTENFTTYTWSLTVKSYLNFDRTAFTRAVERLRQAHLLPAVITDVST